MKVLLVEDQLRIGQFTKKGLGENGFTVTLATSCSEAANALCETGYDVVVLDLGLPDGDGLDLLRNWRRSGFKESVIILSARNAVQDRIDGLNDGADDFLAKPFSMEELVARVRSLVRRQSASKETLLQHRDIKLDIVNRAVWLKQDRLDLTHREFALLETFMRNPGRTLTRSLICEKIWEAHYDVNENLLDVYMSKLRAKVETLLERPVFKTIRGVGYQLL